MVIIINIRNYRMIAGRHTITQVRNSSGKLKELGIRLKSIRNIEKITKTMKMISSAKFAKVFARNNTYNSLKLPVGYFIFSGIKNDRTRPCFRCRRTSHQCRK